MQTFSIYYGGQSPMVARGINQCNLLGFAEKYRGWHTIANNRATKQAIEALSKKGYLEVSGDQFRFTYPKKV